VSPRSVTTLCWRLSYLVARDTPVGQNRCLRNISNLELSVSAAKKIIFRDAKNRFPEAYLQNSSTFTAFCVSVSDTYNHFWTCPSCLSADLHFKKLPQIKFKVYNLLKTAIDCCQAESPIQRDARGCVHTVRVAHYCLHANCPRMTDTEKDQWPRNFPNLNPLEISYLWSDAWSDFESITQSQNSLWFKSQTGEDFPQVQLAKLSRVVHRKRGEYMKADGGRFEY